MALDAAQPIDELTEIVGGQIGLPSSSSEQA
jgi:hypothetical protein